MENDWFFADQVENIDTKLTDQALKGITTNDVDKHTEYMTADEMKALSEYDIDTNTLSVPGEIILKDGHAQYIVDNEELRKIILKTFYK